ncbi:uncharacterized protein LAESUDRAFT_670810 [Laetiporus sulphureus 93-53]|uniref:EGF-like domain-containing protein n=1 Tax=Laetiporus sulphureus 93-53 TaxID=1314785 RepID=A0A165H298_9APHY|nr:uncharacterized protein LAESUDRAFT_670810 [Laetiporus sulphureus 93-53]KZT11145.1 hypothetical protein LAESUDRAFT_670810 [Laetiporus sulphureus 93-53]
MFASLFAIPFLYGASVAAADSVSYVCVAGQCVEGFANITIGATLSGSSYSLQLLPDTYTSTSNPEVLHDLLTSSNSTLSPSTGFSANKTISLPLDLALEAGIITYADANYSGSASFTALNTNASTANTSKELSAGSFALASNMWASFSGSTSDNRVIFWDAVPDLSQLPSSTISSPLTLLGMESSSCSPACSSAGVCTSSGTCECKAGFTGSQCESCESNRFGPDCLACPAGCADCDDGLQGTGKCLQFEVSDLPSTCNCINGVCESNGECTCNAGWTTASNGTACATCAAGFFLDSSGNCEICGLGCTECADGTGDCITCSSGFSRSSDDATECNALQQTTSSGTVCPDGSFSNGTTCVTCSTSCQTCNGATSNDCIICASGSYKLNGSCVSTNSDGVCENSVMIGNNNKFECDSCPAKCTKCEIAGFSAASTTNEATCTDCVAGYVLSDGACVESCPSGTFLSPTDNLTCTACDSSCSTCVGSSTFCLSCSDSKLASDGSCVSSCPSGTFSSSGSCLACHPDCASCSGGSFNQCSSCNSDRPVLDNGRCLPTCSQSEFFDTTSSSCVSCDSSCSSCSGSGSGNCLACSSSSQVLRGGTCVDADCGNSSSVVTGLGICLSSLVSSSSDTTSASDTTSRTSTTTTSLAWWEIMLMVLGCAFIFFIIVMLWRQRMRKKRVQATRKFALAKSLDRPQGWRWRLVRFFRRGPRHQPHVVPDEESFEDVKLEKLREAEGARYPLSFVMEKSRYQPEPLPSLRNYEDDNVQRPPRHQRRTSGVSLTTDSIYTQVTGYPRRAPQPRQPVRNPRDLLPSRFSDMTYASDERLEQARALTPAQEYARSVTQQRDLLAPSHTGGSRSNNPFLR